MNRGVILIVFLVVLLVSCGMEVIPDRDYITKEECLEDEVKERGDWDSLKVLDSYTDGETRKVKVTWDIDETEIGEHDIEYHFTEYYYILWNNTDIYNWSWEYGWNILNGPYRSN